MMRCLAIAIILAMTAISAAAQAKPELLAAKLNREKAFIARTVGRERSEGRDRLTPARLSRAITVVDIDHDGLSDYMIDYHKVLTRRGAALAVAISNYGAGRKRATRVGSGTRWCARSKSRVETVKSSLISTFTAATAGHSAPLLVPPASPGIHERGEWWSVRRPAVTRPCG